MELRPRLALLPASLVPIDDELRFPESLENNFDGVRNTLAIFSMVDGCRFFGGEAWRVFTGETMGAFKGETPLLDVATSRSFEGEA